MTLRNKFAEILAYRTTPKVILIISAFVFLFNLTCFGLLSNVYNYAFVGALFELLFFPMLLLLVVLPVLCVVLLLKFKGTVKGYAIASLVLILAAIFILMQASK